MKVYILTTAAWDESPKAHDYFEKVLEAPRVFLTREGAKTTAEVEYRDHMRDMLEGTDETTPDLEWNDNDNIDQATDDALQITWRVTEIEVR